MKTSQAKKKVKKSETVKLQKLEFVEINQHEEDIARNHLITIGQLLRDKKMYQHQILMLQVEVDFLKQKLRTYE